MTQFPSFPSRKRDIIAKMFEKNYFLIIYFYYYNLNFKMFITIMKIIKNQNLNYF